MTTAHAPAPAPSHLLIGETVHYRAGDRCWAAAIVESGPDESAQLFVFPLPPSFPMPASPGTFVDHGRDPNDETWHRLDECPDAESQPRRRSRRRQRGERARP